MEFKEIDNFKVFIKGEDGIFTKGYYRVKGDAYSFEYKGQVFVLHRSFGNPARSGWKVSHISGLGVGPTKKTKREAVDHAIGRMKNMTEEWIAGVVKKRTKEIEQTLAKAGVQ